MLYYGTEACIATIYFIFYPIDELKISKIKVHPDSAMILLQYSYVSLADIIGKQVDSCCIVSA